jgi:long-chain acyl-CoA synthetase
MTSTIGEILPVAAQRFGARTALLVGGRSFSFDELHALSSRAANGLLAAGVEAGDRVALYGPNCWEWLVAYYAIAKTGAVVIPVNVMLTPDEVRFVVEDSGTRAVVASADKGEPLLELCGTGQLRDVVLWGDEIPAGATAFADWLVDGRPEFSPVRRDGGDLAAICYTSGTTGRPKGAMQPHRAVIGAAVGTAVMAARGPDDRVINSLPLPHVYGSCVFNAAVMAGSTLIMVPRFDAEIVLRAIGEHRATLMDGVPTAYYYLLAHPDFETYDLSSLTRCWVGGQTLPVAKALEFTERTGCPIHEVWGMTELAGATSANPVVGPNKPGTIGIPYPGNAMRVVDITDATSEMPIGERGELMFRGPLVMLGYYGNEQGTAATIEPDGWLHTGDVATMDEDGYFTIVDRMKDMILTAGFNVYPRRSSGSCARTRRSRSPPSARSRTRRRASSPRPTSSSCPTRTSHARSSSRIADSISPPTRSRGRSSSRRRYPRPRPARSCAVCSPTSTTGPQPQRRTRTSPRHDNRPRLRGPRRSCHRHRGSHSTLSHVTERRHWRAVVAPVAFARWAGRARSLRTRLGPPGVSVSEPVSGSVVLDSAGRRRSPATMRLCWSARWLARCLWCWCLPREGGWAACVREPLRVRGERCGFAARGFRGWALV